MVFSFFLKTIFLFFITCLWSANIHAAGGLRWDETFKTIFPNMDDDGTIRLTRKLTDLTTSNGMSIPLIIEFRSSNGISPQLGYWWCLPLLESTFTRFNESRYMAILPNGTKLSLFADSRNPTVLWSSKKYWRADLDGKEAILRSRDGDKLIFQDGQLTLLDLPEGQFSFEYQDGRLTAVTDGSWFAKKFLQLTHDSSGALAGLQLADGREIKFERKNLPLQKGFPQGAALSRAVLPDGTSFSLSYRASIDGKPSMGIDDEIFSWDPKTFQITGDRDWKYRIKQNRDAESYSRVHRQTGKQEFWSIDRKKGIEIEAKHKFNDAWSSYVNYAWESEDIEGEHNYNLPKHLLHFGVEYQRNKWDILADAQYVSARQSPDVDTGKYYSEDAFFITNLAFNYNVTPEAKLQFTVYNLFDKTFYATEAASERTYTVSLQYSF